MSHFTGKGETHLVVAIAALARRLEIMKEGTRSQCQTFIRRRVRNNQPTHFCYIIRNTRRAVDRFKENHLVD